MCLSGGPHLGSPPQPPEPGAGVGTPNPRPSHGQAGYAVVASQVVHDASDDVRRRLERFLDVVRVEHELRVVTDGVLQNTRCRW